MKLSLLFYLLSTSLSFAQELGPQEDLAANYGLAIERRDTCVARSSGISKRSNTCNAMGTLEPDQPTASFEHYSYQHCATQCLCDESRSLCKSFSWKPNNFGEDRGLCKLYPDFLENMHFHHGTSKKAQEYSDRYCYKKAKGTATGVHTYAAATPSPVAKRDPVADYIIEAMAGL